MKKLLLSIAAVLMTLGASAQTATDKYTVNLKDGKTEEFKIAENNRIKFTDANTMGNYMAGFEEYGTINSWNVNDISNVTFDVFHEKAINLNGVNLADDKANDKAKMLYNYLRMNYGVKIISGVTADVAWNHTIADRIGKATGKYPALNCYDFIHIAVPNQGSNGWINYNDITPVTEWAEAGGIVNLMWHFNVPKNASTTVGQDGSGQAIKPEETTFKASNALVNGTWENKFFMQQLENVANVMLKLQDAGVVALWRPFHEAAGNATLKSGAAWGKAWFWWGADGADTYKQLWQTMFNYFQKKGIHNLIWEWTAQNYNGDSNTYNNDQDWYPGDGYVDIVGRDLYGNSAEQQAKEFNQLRALYPSKLITLSECGVDANKNTPTADVDAAWNAGAKWMNFMGWYGTTLPADSWWSAAWKSDKVITRDQVNLKASFVEESAQSAVLNFGLGFNLGNTLDANGIGKGKEVNAYETCWGQKTTTPQMMFFLKAQGFNAVRIPVTWYEHMDDNGKVDAKWMARVKEIIDYAMNAGLYVIVNVHHDTAAGSGAWIKADNTVFNNTKERYQYLWTQIANEFKDYDQHLLFEGYNEMLDASNTWNAPLNSSSYTALNNYAQAFVDAVRATGGNNSKRNLIVNTYAAAKGAEVLKNFTLPTDKASNHLIAQVHSYDPYNWINVYGEWNANCHKDLSNIFTDLSNKFTTVPYIIGEYGTHGANEASVTKNSSAKLIQAAADQAADMVKLAKEHKAGTFYWMNIFDGEDRVVPQWTLPTVAEAMKNAYNN